MSQRRYTFAAEANSRELRVVAALAVVAIAVMPYRQAAGQSPTMELTQIGSPIWRPVDYALFSAPIEPEEAFLSTVDAVLGMTYTAHAPPYDTELSANVAAAGFVSRSVFPGKAITAEPNGIFFPIMLLPDPGILGVSRDFASGPVIPNALFPFTSNAEVWKDGEFHTLLDGGSPLPVRPEDAPFEGTSHRIRVGNMWNRGPDPLGSYEIRWSLVDTQGHGWEMVFPFKVVHGADFDEDGDVDSMDLSLLKESFGQSSTALHADGDADFDGDVDGADFLVWQQELGRTSSLAALSPVPEPPAIDVMVVGTFALVIIVRNIIFSRTLKLRSHQINPVSVAV